MTPDQLAKSGTEHGHQVAFFAYMAVAKLHGWTIADRWAETGEVPEWDGNLLALPCLEWLHAIPNGGSRDSDKKGAMIRGAAMKAEGVKAGVADIFLPVPLKERINNRDYYYYCGLYIEMKKPSQKPVRADAKGGCSDDQLEFKDYALKNGYGWAVCYSWQEAVSVVKSYLDYHYL